MLFEPLSVEDFRGHFNLNMLASRTVNGVKLRLYINTFAVSGKVEYLVENASVRKQWPVPTLDEAVKLFNAKVEESASVRI